MQNKFSIFESTQIIIILVTFSTLSILNRFKIIFFNSFKIIIMYPRNILYIPKRKIFLLHYYYYNCHYYYSWLYLITILFQQRYYLILFEHSSEISTEKIECFLRPLQFTVTYPQKIYIYIYHKIVLVIEINLQKKKQTIFYNIRLFICFKK